MVRTAFSVRADLRSSLDLFQNETGKDWTVVSMVGITGSLHGHCLS